jgi:hypothetical protein
MPNCRQCPKQAELVVDPGTIEGEGPEYFCTGCYVNLCNGVSGCCFGSIMPPAKYLRDGSPFLVQRSSYHFPGLLPTSGTISHSYGYESVAGAAKRKQDIVDSARRIVDEWRKNNEFKYCSVPLQNAIQEALGMLHAYNQETYDFIEALLAETDREAK